LLQVSDDVTVFFALSGAVLPDEVVAVSRRRRAPLASVYEDDLSWALSILSLGIAFRCWV